MTNRTAIATLRGWMICHVNNVDCCITSTCSFINENMELQDIEDGFDLTVPPIQYEYLDHTADVQIHSWGKDLKEAFEQCAMGMFGYITDLNTVRMEKYSDLEITGGDDEKSMLYRFLDDCLFLFNAEPFLIPRKVSITEMIWNESDGPRITVRCFGEVFDLDRHPQGTEVKAITYSNMQIHQTKNDRVDVYVIIDI